MSIYSKVLERISQDNISLSTPSRSHTVGEIKRTIDKYRGLLGSSNLEGQRVAILINSIETYIPLFLAVNHIKGTVVPLSLQSRNDDLVRVLDSLDPHIVFTVNEDSGFSFSTVIKEWAAGRDNRTIIFTSEDCVNWEKETFGNDMKPISEFSGGFITFTSGSTGIPKGIVFEDDNVDYTLNCLSSSYELKPTDNMFVYASTSTFYWVVAMSTVLRNGANLVVSDEFNFPKIIDTMEKTKCNKFTTTPSIFKSLYDFASRLKPDVLRRLEVVCVVGEKITPSFTRNFTLMENCRFLSHYGSSEAGSIADGYIDKHADELEFVLVNGAEHKLVDGELLLKTGGMFTKYYNNPTITQETFENGWFKTGDLVEFLSDRRFKIVGRKKDVIKKGGRQVVSSEVENFLLGIKGINSVAVIGSPHDVYGEQIVAFVISQEVTTKDIRSYCLDRISAYKIPDKIVFIDKLPLINNKVDKVKLKSMI